MGDLEQENGGYILAENGNKIATDPAATAPAATAPAGSGPQLEIDNAYSEYIAASNPQLKVDDAYVEYSRVRTDTHLQADNAYVEYSRIRTDTHLQVDSAYIEYIIPNSPPSSILATQVAALALTTGPPSAARVTQLAVLTLQPVQVETYSALAFIQRVIDLFPKSWVSKSALLPGGGWYLFFKGVGTSLAVHKLSQLDYVSLQTRIRTATGTNLDNISLDFFGGELPRLSGESDLAFSTRIITTLIAPKATLAAVQTAVNEYYSQQYASNLAKKPTAIVFDQTSNPTLAAQYKITPPEFAIAVTFPVLTGAGWFLGRSYLSRNSYLINTSTYTNAPFNDPELEAIVMSIKAEGCKPVYLQKRTY